jgi:hypothetical protein
VKREEFRGALPIPIRIIMFKIIEKSNSKGVYKMVLEGDTSKITALSCLLISSRGKISSRPILFATARETASRSL